MKPFKVLVGTDACDRISRADALRYEGSVWLVPDWIEHPVKKSREPRRGIRVPEHFLQEAPPGFRAELLVTVPVPMSALVGPLDESGSVGEFEVREPLPVRVLTVASRLH